MSKNNFRSESLALAALLVVACGDDSSSTTDAVGEADAAASETAEEGVNTEDTQEAETETVTSESDETDPATVPREGPEGCYMSETHVCDCDLDEAECEDASGTWTTGCNSCAPSEADAGSTPAPDSDAGASEPAGPLGCYLPEAHTCDCAVDEAGCTELDGIWTEGCDSCAGALADAGSLPSDAGAPPSDAGTATNDAGTPQPDASSAPSDAGTSQNDAGANSATLACYLPDAHACDCTLDEAECTTVAGIWTEGCGCTDAGKEPTP